MGRNDPGSKSAIRRGCSCPIVDNHYGKGVATLAGEPMFWVDGNCPLHGQDNILEDEDDDYID